MCFSDVFDSNRSNQLSDNRFDSGYSSPYRHESEIGCDIELDSTPHFADPPLDSDTNACNSESEIGCDIELDSTPHFADPPLDSDTNACNSESVLNIEFNSTLPASLIDSNSDACDL